MIHVLFVCLGNICRSPTAHGVFQQRVAKSGLGQHIVVDSAGTGGWHAGSAPDARAIAAAAKQGYQLDGLRARQVRLEDFQQYDYVIAMDNTNLADLQALCPTAFQGELSLLLGYCTSNSNLDSREVPDPYYSGGNGFQRVIQLVEQGSDGLLQHIIQQHDLKPEAHVSH